MSPFQRNILMRHKQTEVHRLLHFKSKTIFEAILRMENIKEIYHKYKIHEILNCDMTQALEKDFEEKSLSKLF